MDGARRICYPELIALVHFRRTHEARDHQHHHHHKKGQVFAMFKKESCTTYSIHFAIIMLEAALHLLEPELSYTLPSKLGEFRLQEFDKCFNYKLGD